MKAGEFSQVFARGNDGFFFVKILKTTAAKPISRDEIANLQVGVRERIADYTKNIELPEKVDSDYFNFMYMMQTWKGTPYEFADYYADWELAQDPDDRGTQILYHNREYHKSALRMFERGYYHYSFKGSEYNTDNIKGLPPDELIDQFRYVNLTIAT